MKLSFAEAMEIYDNLKKRRVEIVRHMTRFHTEDVETHLLQLKDIEKQIEDIEQADVDARFLIEKASAKGVEQK